MRGASCFCEALIVSRLSVIVKCMGKGEIAIAS